MYKVKQRFWYWKQTLLRGHYCTSYNSQLALVQTLNETLQTCSSSLFEDVALAGLEPCISSEISLPLLCYLAQQLKVKSCAFTTSLHLNHGKPLFQEAYGTLSSPCPNS